MDGYAGIYAGMEIKTGARGHVKRGPSLDRFVSFQDCIN